MILLLLACSAGPTGSGGDDSGKGADGPAQCVEVARTEVVNRTQPTAPLDWAPGDTLSAAGGGHVGVVEEERGEVWTLSASFAIYTVWAVDLEREDSGGADTGPAMGVPDPVCADTYVAEVEVGFDASPALAPVFTVEATLDAPGAIAWSAEVAFADLAGEVRPVDLDPDDWERLDLSLTGTWNDPGWTGTLTWQASGSLTAAGEGASDTGTVPVAGATEPCGTWLAG